MPDYKKVVIDALSYKKSKKVPYFFDFIPPAKEKLENYYIDNRVDEILDLPIKWGGTESIKPLYTSPDRYGRYLSDKFGVKWELSYFDRGSPVGHPLKKPDLSRYKFPDPASAYRFSHLPEWCRRNSDYFRLIWLGALWERATFIIGMRGLLTDLYLNKGFVYKLLEKLKEYNLMTMEIIIEICDFEAFGLSDDYGTQKDLIMSPEMWRLFIKPNLIEIFNLAKNNNKAIMLHSCGNIYKIIGDLVDIGLDILHPIQPEAMDIYRLKKEFGDNITFEGGISTQYLLLNYSSEEIRVRVREIKKRMSINGGYILDTEITIQGDIPIENLIVLIEVAREFN